MTTEILILDELVSGQGNPDITHNSALRQIEGKLVRALDKDLTVAPVTPANGDVYIVATGATGTWSSKDKKIAHFWGGSWKYYQPIEGNSLWMNDEDKRYIFDGTNWIVEPAFMSDGDKGDITVSSSGSVLTIDNDVVTYAKIQNVSATDKILGRSTAGAGDVEEITCTAAGRALIDDADAAAQRTTLGLGTVATATIDTDGTMAANSSTRVPSQSAVVTYVDSRITSGASDVMIFKGVIDCSANPNYPAADAGNLYKVSVAGKIGGASGPNVEVGDTLYCTTDSTASGTQAGVGANWCITQVNIDGAVVGPASSTNNHLCLFDGTTGKLIQDASLSSVLDQITSTQGSVLYRGASSWNALAAGTSGQVLRTAGSGNDPGWATVGAGTTGGSSLAWPIQGTPSASGTSTASHGAYFIALTDFTVLGLWGLVTTVAGATYRVSIYQVNSSGVISSVVADSADIASPGAVTGTNVGARFATPPVLTAGNSYIVNFRRTDGGDTAVVGVYGLSTSSLPTYTGLPIQLLGTTQTKFATLAKATPAIGDTFTLGGNGYYVMGVLYTA